MENIQASFERLCEIIDILLGENGCPWDRAQTIKSLREDLLEECYEALEAADKYKNNPSSPHNGSVTEIIPLCEELGDVLLTVVLMAKKAERDGAFKIEDVLRGICGKMTSRHSHVFGSDTARSESDALSVWNKNKSAEKKYSNEYEKLLSVPRTMPSLLRAQKIIGKAKLEGELKNCVSDACADLNGDNLKSNFGNFLFKIVKIAKFMDINAEIALTNFLDEFINSYN